MSAGRRPVGGLALSSALCACALGLPACGSNSGSGSETAASSGLDVSTRPVDLPAGVVASVAGGAVSRGELDRTVASRSRHVARGGSDARRLRRVALTRSSMLQLIQAEATVQAAKAAGVNVTPQRVDAALVAAREPFDSPGEWRSYLKRTDQTETEIRARLRLELLNRRLPNHRQLAARRIRAATQCRPGYIVSLCSNSPSKPTEATR